MVYIAKKPNVVRADRVETTANLPGGVYETRYGVLKLSGKWTNSGQRLQVKLGDWILTKADGTKEVITKEEFAEHYYIVEDLEAR